MLCRIPEYSQEGRENEPLALNFWLINAAVVNFADIRVPVDAVNLIEFMNIIAIRKTFERAVHI